VHLLVPIRVRITRNNERIHWFLHLVELIQQVELRSTKLPSLIFLVPASTEDNDFSSELACKLDRKMTQPTNADDADALARLDHGRYRVICGCSGALERRGVLASKAVRDLMEIRLYTDVVFAVSTSATSPEITTLFLPESPVGIVRLAKDASLIAPNVLSRQTVATVATGVTMVTSAGSLADFELRHIASDCFHGTNAFVAERNAVFDVCKICGTHTRVRDLDEDFFRAELWDLCSRLLDAAFGSAVDGVLGCWCCRHVGFKGLLGVVL